MVRVCDSIMGTGKSSAAITLINEYPNYRYIYITPYLDEAARIKKGCPDAHFVEPSDKLKQYHNKKSEHTAALIKKGKNIATTHQAFKNYNAEMLEDIKRQNYVLIIDENVEVLETFDIHPDDLKLTVDAGYVSENNGVYSIVNSAYSGNAMRELFSMMKSRELVKLEDDKNNELFYWALPPELILSFKEVFILTYLFEGQSIHHFLKIYDIPYELIGVTRTGYDTFRFCGYPGYTPKYVSNLKNMLHILERNKINDIGDDFHALSKSWFERGGPELEQLRKNLNNYYRNIWADIPADRRLWGSYKGAFTKMRGKGYTNAFLTFNAKATNNFRTRDCLVYIANVFMNVNEKKFYQMHGIEVDEDMYALSIMVQWIWRSAIRDGKEINLYIPSRRMRTLLTKWIDSFSEGGKAND